MIAVDRLVNLTAKAVYVTGDWGRPIQTGRLRNYLMLLTVGLIGVFAGVFIWIEAKRLSRKVLVGCSASTDPGPFREYWCSQSTLRD